MLDNLKFAQYVNEERKKLIKSTRERGIDIKDNATLSEAVSRNSEIKPYQELDSNKVFVEYLDGDGTLLKREFIDKGGTTTPPNDPNLDADYLIFDGWNDTEFTNITESKSISAKYITKDNATYLFIYVPTASKSLTLKFSGTITSVDWGDGTIDTSLSHTYSSIGNYVIKVVGGTKITATILGSSENNQMLSKCYMSNSITSLATNYNSPGTFTSCYSLTSIILSDNITAITNYAFSSCYSLQKIVIPLGVTTLNQNAFSECPSLKKIVLPNILRIIEGNVFYRCYSLKSINIPNNVSTLSSYSFQDCSSLEKIKLPNNISTIYNDTFSYCKALTDINIPDNITSIGRQAFYCCYSLIKIFLPSATQSIGNGAFVGCYNIKQFVINSNNIITIQADSFSTSMYNIKFYVPDNLVEDYKVATNWVQFADRIYPLSEIGE